MKRKQLQDAVDLVDQVRLDCERYRSVMQIVLDERKRPPYLNAEEIETVTDGIEEAKDRLQQALEAIREI